MADQAAGLRRRSTAQQARHLLVYSDAAECVIRLARALRERGRHTLVVDAGARLFGDAPARPLFDWRQQLARGRLHTIPLAGGEGWHAPGARADEVMRHAALQGYDTVLFDTDEAAGASSLPAAPGAVIIEVHAAHASLFRAYGIVKSLAHVGAGGPIGLLGDAAACERVRAACGHFLGERVQERVYSAAQEDDAFAALAVRMAGEETSASAR